MKNISMLLLVAATWGGCSWSDFDDLSEKAPAVKINQNGDPASASFGDSLVGLERSEGGTLLISGNGGAVLGKALLTTEGGIHYSQLSKIKEYLNNPNRILAMAPVPISPPVGDNNGPYAYVASATGEGDMVKVMDVSNLRPANSDSIKPLSSWQPAISDFGLSLAAANLGSGASREDLVVGARDAVVLLRVNAETKWPNFILDKPMILAEGTDWPKGGFKTLAVGKLDAGSTDSVDEIVAGIPDQNAVVIIYNIQDCWQKLAEDPPQACDKMFHRLPVPDGANGFGSALLVADVDQNGQAELVVGASNSNQVFVYSFANLGPLATVKSLPNPQRTLTAPGAGSFGAALAFGRFDTQEYTLAVGAPSTTVSEVEKAGKIFLFSPGQESPIGEGVSLASPEANALLGRTLTILPFHVPSQEQAYDVLAASGQEAVFLFFNYLTPNHQDIRAH